MRKQISRTSSSAEETRKLGRRLGERMPAGAVIAAEGDLGAGKTLLAAAIAQGLGVSERVTSPTFIYFNSYDSGRVPFVHIDAYRMEDMDSDEKALIGLDDCFRLCNAVFIEWPQFAAEWLPPETIRLTITRPALHGNTGGGDDEQRELLFDFDDGEEWLNEALGD